MSAAEIALVADTGAEVLAGSTRMKAGTAQKALLTCLSTGVFVRLGHVYRGRMIEMEPTNEKLQARAAAMAPCAVNAAVIFPAARRINVTPENLCA